MTWMWQPQPLLPFAPSSRSLDNAVDLCFELAGGRAVGFYTANEKILGYQRIGEDSTVLCLVNFGDHPEWVGRDQFMGCPEEAKDLVSGYIINLRKAGVQLRAHQYLWLSYSHQ